MSNYTYLTIKDITLDSYQEFMDSYTNPQKTVIYLDSNGGDLNVAIDWAKQINSPIILKSAISAAAHLIFLIPKIYRYYYPNSYVVFKPVTIPEFTEEYTELLSNTKMRLLPYINSLGHPLFGKQKPFDSYVCITYRTLSEFGFKPHFNVPISL